MALSSIEDLLFPGVDVELERLTAGPEVVLLEAAACGPDRRRCPAFRAEGLWPSQGGREVRQLPAGPLVLMADGGTKPIDEVRPGDAVEAGNPQTGETAGKPVTDKIVTPDDSRFTDLILAKTDKNGTPGTEIKLTSTAHHPCWDDTTHRWTTADDLQPGGQLTTPDHGHVTIIFDHVAMIGIMTCCLTGQDHSHLARTLNPGSRDETPSEAIHFTGRGGVA
ncbi:Hint domain-containing protein [Kitasatospora sp. NPDC053057]|uniref:Hint domain-containing protein n=1 Tax=Kitasatospora sp. NPDC053057 TaxID=3364062 RepID=UPI0037CC62E6